MQYGYCTNIHAGSDYASVLENLERYSVAIHEQIESSEFLNVGLWLSNEATMEITSGDLASPFADWLAEHRLFPFTLNVFPYHNFHEPVVKHRVYLPTWADDSRYEYTLASAKLLDQLIPGSARGTLSTLPLGWPVKENHNEFLEACAANIRRCADGLARIRETSGRLLMVCLEPEPGCCLQYSGDVVEFFDEHLLTGSPDIDARIKTHIGVCHDVCHAAVMFEEQAAALQTYRDAGITIGKVQVSSAIETRFADSDVGDRGALIKQLEEFVEPRYLHQTVIKTRDGSTTFFEDLPKAVGHVEEDASLMTDSISWRTHFHVPIYLESLGNGLLTTQRQIRECVDWFSQAGITVPWEIETYAWNVSPGSIKQSRTMVESISDEMNWFRQQFA